MSEGELYGKIKEDAVVHPFGDWTIEEDLLKIVLDEAKKDLGLDRLIFTRKQMEERLNKDSMTQLEYNNALLLIKLLKFD